MVHCVKPGNDRTKELGYTLKQQGLSPLTYNISQVQERANKFHPQLQPATESRGCVISIECRMQFFMDYTRPSLEGILYVLSPILCTNHKHSHAPIDGVSHKYIMH